MTAIMKPTKKFVLTRYLADLIPPLLALDRPVLLQGRNDEKPFPVVAMTREGPEIVTQDGRRTLSTESLVSSGVYVHINPDDLIVAGGEYARQLRSRGAEYQLKRERRYLAGELVTLRDGAPYRWPKPGCPASVIEDDPELAKRATVSNADFFQRAEVLVSAMTPDGFRPFLIDPFWLKPWTGNPSRPVEDSTAPNAHDRAFAELNKTLNDTTH